MADAAWEGDWRAAEAYVAAAGDDWDERWSRIELLQQLAGEDDAWLEAWRTARPDNCDAATVLAGRMVHKAWEIRGSEYAHEVPSERMRQFRTLLPAAIAEARRAAVLDPENPSPWVVMVTAARGAQYDHDQFQPLWDGLTARAPYHYEGHGQALQYWCAKWFGSDKSMMGFAEQAVRKAPQGSPLAGMYLHALEELVKPSAPSTLPTQAAKKRLEEVAASLAEVGPDDQHLPALRHLLAHHMMRARMYAAALEQFRLIGPWCGAAPWRRGDGSPEVAFELARGTAAKLSRVAPSAAPPVTHPISH